MSDRRISDKGWLGGLLDHGSPLDYNMFKMPQNRLHESLMKLSWVRPSFSPPCRPCCSLGGNVLWDGEGMHCLCHLYFLAALRYVQTVICEEQEMQRRKTQQFFFSHQCVLVSSQRKTCQVSNMGWVCLSMVVWPGDKRTTCLKLSIIMINGGIWMLSTPIHEQPSLTAESSPCL
uniref:Uncharacterized protein n=1 Tax=Myotis myotis TaxID=51298 RepID=A0A7J7VI63_MYOMY|nr:hypothetical protein mMyoMyo1_008275 [Myotis myotis]